MDKFQRDLDRHIEREQPDDDNNGYPKFIDGSDLPPLEQGPLEEDDPYDDHYDSQFDE